MQSSSSELSSLEMASVQVYSDWEVSAEVPSGVGSIVNINLRYGIDGSAGPMQPVVRSPDYRSALSHISHAAKARLDDVQTDSGWVDLY